MPHNFTSRLTAAQQESGSMLCVGIDPDPSRIPPVLRSSASMADAILRFNLDIIEATAPFASAFKLNFAFFETLGSDGWRVLERSVRAARAHRPVIADAKRGDIGNSARFYAQAVFEQLQFDACTVAPYMGAESVSPFLDYPGRAAFVLVRTSNPGAEQVQEVETDGGPLYRRVAAWSAEWAATLPGELGFVVGATNAAPVGAIRSEHPDVPLLVPGVGAQGGDVASLLAALSSGHAPVLINSSRQILYASSGADYAAAAESAARTLREQISMG